MTYMDFKKWFDYFIFYNKSISSEVKQIISSIDKAVKIDSFLTPNLYDMELYRMVIPSGKTVYLKFADIIIPDVIVSIEITKHTGLLHDLKITDYEKTLILRAATETYMI